MAEAVRQLEKGLRLLAAMPSNPACQQQELDLLIALGQALVATTGYSSAEVGQTFARASSLAEQLGRFDYVPRPYGGRSVRQLQAPRVREPIVGYQHPLSLYEELVMMGSAA